MVLQGGVLLSIGAGTVCFTTLGLETFLHLNPVQHWASLTAVIVVGIAGGIAAVAATVCTIRPTVMPSWLLRGHTVRWFRASIALYPAVQTIVSVSLALLLTPGQTQQDSEQRTAFLHTEHEHLSENEASYFATHLMIVPILVAVQLMLRAGFGAVVSLVGFSAMHFWVACDDRADVSDDLCLAGILAHAGLLLMALVPRLCLPWVLHVIRRAQCWRSRSSNYSMRVHAAAKDE